MTLSGRDVQQFPKQQGLGLLEGWPIMAVIKDGVEYQDLVLEVAGKQVAFRATPTEKGNVAWAVRKAAGSGKIPMYGVPIPALAKQLPKSVKVTDPASGKSIQVALEQGETQNGRKRAFYQGQNVLPNGETRMLKVAFSIGKGGEWNAKVVAFGVGGGNGGNRAPVDLADL